VKVGQRRVIPRIIDHGGRDAFPFCATDGVAGVLVEGREQGVIVRELPGRNLIRVSCGYWTSEEDLDRLVSGLS